MRDLVFKTRLHRDLKRVLKRGKDRSKLLAVAHLLAQGAPLSESAYPHKLSGPYDGLWECHIEHDWLLVYEIIDDYVTLHRTGSHEDLFG